MDYKDIEIRKSDSIPLSRFQLFKYQQKCSIIFNISVNFKNTKKVEHILESSFNVNIFWCTLCYSLIIGNQRRYSSRLSILMFIETSCSDTKILIFKQIMLLIAQINLEWEINSISQIRLKSHVIIIVPFSFKLWEIFIILLDLILPVVDCQDSPAKETINIRFCEFLWFELWKKYIF